MVLQRFVWKTEELPETAGLYYHADAPLSVSGEALLAPAGARVSFDTYFNVFVAKSWRRYTKLSSIRFRVLASGSGRLLLMRENGDCVAQQGFAGKQEIVFTLGRLYAAAYYLVLEAQGAVTLERAAVETEETAEREIRIALVTCTYRREEELLRNLRLLQEANREMEDGETTLERIYVVDNGRSLPAQAAEDARTVLIPNANTGGSGGFTRGIQEAMKLEGMTHIVLMDDDVWLEFEAFRRTKSFLSYVRKEYEGNFLGGAMLRRDVPYLLHAAGEDWADGRIRNPHGRTDLRNLRNVLKVAEPVRAKQPYAGWWYCCIPHSHVERKGFPMPFFLHGDDVEYSLRSGKVPIYLNGIAVWHEEFEDKRSSVIEYYDVRNRLIVNALYKERGQLRNAFSVLCERFYATVFRYRYKDFALSVRAFGDFLKGPEWLYGADAEALHRTLSGYGYAMQEVSEKPERQEYPKYCRVNTIMDYFLPVSGRAVLRMGAPVGAYAGKRRVLLVEPKSGKGFEVEKSWRETARCAGQFAGLLWKMSTRYRRARKMWLEEQKVRNMANEAVENTI